MQKILHITNQNKIKRIVHSNTSGICTNCTAGDFDECLKSGKYMGKSSAENEQKSTGPFYYEIFKHEFVYQ